jgi:hypothetical protein
MSELRLLSLVVGFLSNFSRVERRAIDSTSLFPAGWGDLFSPLPFTRPIDSQNPGYLADCAQET